MMKNKELIKWLGEIVEEREKVSGVWIFGRGRRDEITQRLYEYDELMFKVNWFKKQLSCLNEVVQKKE